MTVSLYSCIPKVLSNRSKNRMKFYLKNLEFTLKTARCFFFCLFLLTIHSSFLFFLFLNSLLAPNFSSLSHPAVQLPRSTRSMHRIISCQNRIKIQYSLNNYLSINKSINLSINHSIILSKINQSVNLSITPPPYTAKRPLIIIYRSLNQKSVHQSIEQQFFCLNMKK